MASLRHLPWEASRARAAWSSADTSGHMGHGVRRLPCLAWGDHHGGMKRPSQWHGATAHPAAAQPHVLPMPCGPFGVPGGP